MITAEIFEAIKFYKELIEKVEKENSNPFEISIEKLKELAGDSIFHNGIIISLLAKLIRLKAEYLEKQIIPQTEEEKKEAVKSIFKQVLQEETGLEEDNIETLLMVDSIKEKLKKPKAVKPKKISYQEFQEIAKSQIREVLHEDTDYNTYALKIAKQIEKGTFKIKSYKDFIGLMFAIYLFNLEINDIKAFL
ncbi:hypothetical protein PERMA_A0004 (plasmid) [Persephonella marina EX-H1]|uniref:Uncharacterized protein n=1 Tax=Persephonella marina (strain DSM 14350 / EX-H1) TaxID=123214 RepID=C0QUT4_PERMH|nr:hypothetical protein [Persephonella marina]ACO04982.1 hypothetical protein PERMA_A0004 [Persephonella marina EX-H1]